MSASHPGRRIGTASEHRPEWRPRSQRCHEGADERAGALGVFEPGPVPGVDRLEPRVDEQMSKLVGGPVTSPGPYLHTRKARQAAGSP